MVYINEVGLTNFKSFGGTISIPLEQGFTVVTGPNGSGKSNILDGVLFCLGLANSKGMRADRLPDLINSGVLRAGKAAETEVSVRFDLSDWEPDAAEDGLEQEIEGPWIRSDQKEWIVSRRLRVMPGGSYSSSYSSDGEPCNLQQLQTQLRRLRIDPEGSNVVMQGDVTRIVSMSNKDRRGLIDELAGVALFDNRIEQTRRKLDDVHERQERCRIVEQELITSKQRLEKDCTKARVYQELKEKMYLGKQQELVLAFDDAKVKLHDLNNKSKNLKEKEILDSKSITDQENKLVESTKLLKNLQENVKNLGEDKLLAVQSELAGLETQSRELDRQALKLKDEGERLNDSRQELIEKRNQLLKDEKNEQKDSNLKSLDSVELACRNAEASVEASRRRLGDVAGKSGAWFEEQRKRNAIRKELQEAIYPLQENQQKLKEGLVQVSSRREELKADQLRDNAQNKEVVEHLDSLESEFKLLQEKITTHKAQYQDAIEALQVQARTFERLDREKTKLERDIARIDSRRDAIQETRGAGALRLLLESGLEGIHGPVAQLGNVENAYRLALDVAAGARLGQIVVDNDQIAAKAIDILKQRKAGRLTFLPLNKIKSTGANGNFALSKGRHPSLDYNQISGCIGQAFQLVKYDSIYRDVFNYVFGDTLVFESLSNARLHIGKTRAVTLDGELLEKSGAMTGGSFLKKSLGLSFSRNHDFDEAEPLRQRLLQLGETLLICSKEKDVKGSLLENIRNLLKQFEERHVALEAERNAFLRSNEPLVERKKKCDDRLKDLDNTKKEYQSKLESINHQINPILVKLNELDKEDENAKVEGDSENWKQLKNELDSADLILLNVRKERDEVLNFHRQRELTLQRYQALKLSLDNEENRLKVEVQNLASAHKEWQKQSEHLVECRKSLEKQQSKLQALFGEQRRARDAAEVEVSKQREILQEAQWKLERLREDQKSLEEEIRSGSNRLKELENSLPQPLPEISDELRNEGLQALQQQLHELQQKMEALEPVNMLALEELEKLEIRLGDLVEKLDILSDERSELLLRIETVGTLRQEAFMEAFEAVDKYFREIFASLSEGDGHLQLDNPEDPLEGGLTLVAHPKGKAVRRLAAMSGGEKSLTALSFLFALQRFRPSPFYALDEVDSFLDGVNVERLSALIATQAQQAQFLVVSHRRPMIGASSRTIGVTQARGAHTQVVGLPAAA